MRIAGITLPDSKRIEIALMAVYGVGRSKSQEILEQAKVDPDKLAKDISEDEENRIRVEIEKIKVEGDLKRQVSGNIKRLKDISAYRGSRHAKGITVRGQRTRTNARTVPAGTSSKTRKRATMGSGRVKVEKK
jgi:small subunit ribosomal protein S13